MQSSRCAIILLGVTCIGCTTHIPPSPSDPAVPELYGVGVFSTAATWDFFMAWSPDERQVFFCQADSSFSQFRILETHRQADGEWSTPVVPRFAAAGSNADPHIAPDGRRLFFISNRPLPTDTGATLRRAYDVWYADRLDDGSWGEAKHLDGPVNRARNTKWSPSVAANGNLYVGTVAQGGRGGNDIWVSRLVGGVYQPLENLGDSINTPMGEIEPWIAPDESYLIFSGAARPDSIGGYDLYIAERRNGAWTRARVLPRPINSDALDFNPSVSPDGKWLYFSSTRKNGLGDIYRVRLDLVRGMK